MVRSLVDKVTGRRVLRALFDTERDATETMAALESARSGHSLDAPARAAVGRLIDRLDAIAGQAVP